MRMSASLMELPVDCANCCEAATKCSLIKEIRTYETHSLCPCCLHVVFFKSAASYLSARGSTTFLPLLKKLAVWSPIPQLWSALTSDEHN